MGTSWPQTFPKILKYFLSNSDKIWETHISDFSYLGHFCSVLISLRHSRLPVITNCDITYPGIFVRCCTSKGSLLVRPVSGAGMRRMSQCHIIASIAQLLLSIPAESMKTGSGHWACIIIFRCLPLWVIDNLCTPGWLPADPISLATYLT